MTFVLIQTYLLYYVNQVILMLTSIFQGQFPQQSKGGLYQNKAKLSLTFTGRLGYLLSPKKKSTTVKWSVVVFENHKQPNSLTVSFKVHSFYRLTIIPRRHICLT